MRQKFNKLKLSKKSIITLNNVRGGGDDGIGTDDDGVIMAKTCTKYLAKSCKKPKQ